LTTLVAVRSIKGVPSVTSCNCDGANVINPFTGGNVWVPGKATNQTYLILKDGAAAGDAIDTLLCQVPKHLQH
jgi:hypothetical protein